MELSFFNSPETIYVMLMISLVRVYLELVNFPFDALPISKAMGQQRALKFHRTGLYICLGTIVLFAPQVLMQ